MIHVVFQHNDISALKKAFELDALMQGEVTGIADDFAVGPIKDIYREEGIEARKQWWRSTLAGGDLDGAVDNGTVADDRTAEPSGAWSAPGACVVGAALEPGADPLPAAGQGIPGMRERLLALGGLFTAGPRPGGGFLVGASLPYQPADIAPTAEMTRRFTCPAWLDGADQCAPLTMEPLT